MCFSLPSELLVRDRKTLVVRGSDVVIGTPEVVVVMGCVPEQIK